MQIYISAGKLKMTVTLMKLKKLVVFMMNHIKYEKKKKLKKKN